MRFVFTIPQTLVDDIDRHRGDVPRAAWIRRACEQRLDQQAIPAVVEDMRPAVPPEAVDVGGVCVHPRRDRRVLGYATLCGVCGVKLV